MNNMSRYDRLMPNGKPRYVRCYLSKCNVTDPYTIVYTGRYIYADGYKLYVSMGLTPHLPNGFCQHGESKYYIDRPSYKHLGKRISFDDLPLVCKKIVISDYMYIWELEEF